MANVRIVYPPLPKNTGSGYWLNLWNIWAARKKLLRSDRSIEWRHQFEARYGAPTANRSTPFSHLLEPPADETFRFLILADTGEGDHSQYALLPVIRGLKPNFMIINGDIAYPAGEEEHYRIGFFEPYRDLRIPVWAVPGNHEYYSKHRGAEFHEVFCTGIRDAAWEAHALKHAVHQPGSYWELKQPDPSHKLVVLGLDSTMKGNLDGKKVGAFARAFGRRGKPSDAEQHQWLDWRLQLADAEKRAVIVLFHIPALTRGRHESKVHLGAVHRILAAHPSVRLIVCGHVHNFQLYRPDAFRDYLIELHKRHPAGDMHYLVSGGGGAFLTSTEFGRGTYGVAERYPTEEQWREYAFWGRRVIDRKSFLRGFLGRVTAQFNESLYADADIGRYLSLLVVDVSPDKTTVTPAFMDSLPALFEGEPPGTEIRVADPQVAVDEQVLKDRCLRHDLKITIERPA